MGEGKGGDFPMGFVIIFLFFMEEATCSAKARNRLNASF